MGPSTDHSPRLLPQGSSSHCSFPAQLPAIDSFLTGTPYPSLSGRAATVLTKSSEGVAVHLQRGNRARY